MKMYETMNYYILEDARDRLAPAVKATPANTEVVAPGISCRQQIQHLAGRRAKHPAEVLWEALAR